MRTIDGKIESLLTNSAGKVNGLVLDSGQMISFPVGGAAKIFSVVAIGSSVEIQAATLDSRRDGGPATAVAITDLLSKKSILFDVLPTDEPEVHANFYPPPGTAPALLAPTQHNPPALGKKASKAATREKVTGAVELAHNHLHHSHVMLEFLRSKHREKSFLLQYLHEAKRTYFQALGRYEARDFEGAWECAAASYELSDMIEILISRAFHSDAQGAASKSHCGLEQVNLAGLLCRMDQIDSHLGRIHWVVANGTLPSEDREQVQKLVSWSESLKGWAGRLVDIGAREEAGEFARAAEAAAGAAEHVCRKCYVTRGDTAAG